MTGSRGIAALVALFAMLAAPPVSAQVIEGGQVVDDSTHGPLMHVIVSLHRFADGAWQVTDSARTDERGMFQFIVPTAGIYRVGVLGTASPEFLGAPDTLAADSMNTRSFAVPLLRLLQKGAFGPFQVERPARMPDTWTAPVYPPELRAQRVEGEVDAQFVVNPDGTVDMTTLSWLRSTDMRFTEAVRQCLLRARFIPATIDGRPVRQVVQQAFMFNLGRAGTGG